MRHPLRTMSCEHVIIINLACGVLSFFCNVLKKWGVLQATPTGHISTPCTPEYDILGTGDWLVLAHTWLVICTLSSFFSFVVNSAEQILHVTQKLIAVS